MENSTFPTVTLCGSMRFWDVMLEQAQAFSRQGWIVLAPFVAFTPDEQINNDQKEMLDRMHFAKIDISSAIFVINVDGYIGESTKREIEYAEKTGKQVYYFDPHISSYTYRVPE